MSDFKRRKQENSFWNRDVKPFWFYLIFILFSISLFSSLNFATPEAEGINTQLSAQNTTTSIVEPLVESQTATTKARITCYTWTGNKMANGKYPKEGYVATSDRNIPFGTIIEIDGIEYEVGDRTAKWVKEKFKHQTIDIYLDNCDLSFGASIKNIIIK